MPAYADTQADFDAALSAAAAKGQAVRCSFTFEFPKIATTCIPSGPMGADKPTCSRELSTGAVCLGDFWLCLLYESAPAPR